MIVHNFGEWKEIPEIAYDSPRFWRVESNFRNLYDRPRFLEKWNKLQKMLW